MKDTYVKAERLWLKSQPTLNEKWIQQLIKADPTILGLGDLNLIDEERRHPKAGRLDLLLRDDDTGKRYEVELQIGTTDESHIIRTIEYWDIERRRYPNSDHCAVLVAEEVNGRFLNVMELLNGAVPFIAIQMQVFRVGESITVVFTKVVNEVLRGSEDEDAEAEAEATPTDRAYWEERASKDTVAMADDLLSILQTFDPSLSLKYNKHYIGLMKDGDAYNFSIFKPKKNHLNLEIKLPRSEELDARIDAGGLELLEYSKQWNLYRIHIAKNDLTQRRKLITELLKLAYDRKTN